VALVQLIGVLVLGVILQIPFSIGQLLAIIPAVIICCLFGGAFGTLVMANLNDQRKANQVFPFVIFPQFFLAGVFTPIRNLPLPLFWLSRLAPMTYAVDLVRAAYFYGTPEYSKVVLYSPLIDLTIIGVLFTLMLGAGTFLFVRNERNK